MRLKTLFLILASLASAAVPHSAFIDERIAAAQAKIKASPAVADGYSDLAFALARRARETEDPAYLAQAEAALSTALKLDPKHFDARKARVIVRLEQQRYADALEEATALNRQVPDDNLMYGLLCDANLALGNYDAAEANAQRMLDMRQVNAPGLERAARVREAIGFPDGATEFWTSSFRLISTGDSEERAYISTQLARVARERGRLDEAERNCLQALTLEPDYPAALLQLARIQLDLAKASAAVDTLKKRLSEGESPTAEYWLAIALEAEGKIQESEQAGRTFMKLARQSVSKEANANVLLIRYLAAHGKAAEAVAIGREAVAKRHDIETEDAYALALSQAGEQKEAQIQIAAALKPGIKNAEYFYDAGLIAKKNGDRTAAADYFRKTLEANANSRYAALAIQELSAGGPVPAK
ncbi:MAG: tetratricopeptide repeat protein [Acidobacteriota bacterium]|nr:tetratricopeptide repeat protein [Acidobacteriota bacterium]